MTTTLTTVATTIYGQRAFQAYQLSDLFGVDSMVFYGVTAADNINIPIVDGSDAINLPDGGDHTLAGTASMTGVDIPVDDPLKAKNMVRRDDIELRPDLQMLARFGRVHGTRVGKGKTERILQHLTDQAVTATNTTDTNYTGSSDVGAAVDKDIKALASTWDEDGIPSEGRHIMLKTELFYELPAVRAIFGREFGGQASAQSVSMSFTIRYLNFFIHNGPIAFGTDFTATASDGLNLPSGQRTDMTNIRATAWHEDSWALRHQTNLLTSFDWIAFKQAYLVMARLFMGMNTLQTSGLHVFRQT